MESFLESPSERDDLPPVVFLALPARALREVIQPGSGFRALFPKSTNWPSISPIVDLRSAKSKQKLGEQEKKETTKTQNENTDSDDHSQSSALRRKPSCVPKDAPLPLVVLATRGVDEEGRLPHQYLPCGVPYVYLGGPMDPSDIVDGKPTFIVASGNAGEKYETLVREMLTCEDLRYPFVVGTVSSRKQPSSSPDTRVHHSTPLSGIGVLDLPLIAQPEGRNNQTSPQCNETGQDEKDSAPTWVSPISSSSCSSEFSSLETAICAAFGHFIALGCGVLSTQWGGSFSPFCAYLTRCTEEVHEFLHALGLNASVAYSVAGLGEFLSYASARRSSYFVMGTRLAHGLPGSYISQKTKHHEPHEAALELLGITKWLDHVEGLLVRARQSPSPEKEQRNNAAEGLQLESVRQMGRTNALRYLCCAPQ